MPKKILAVGLSIGSDHVEYSNFSEKTSLLDWDIVLFRPDIEAFTRYYYSNTEYQGKTCLDDTQSFRLRESCEHWRREIKEIVESGKNVIVFLNEPEELFIATGTKDFSGTGRNQKITRHVAPYSSYESIPIDYSWTTTQGSSMTVSQDVKALLGSYWNRFSKHSTYNVVWQNDAKQACMYTKHGKKPVSLLLRSKSGGTLLLLPDLDFDKTTFFTTRDGEEVYTKAGIEFGTSLVAEIVALDKILHSTFQRTPEPSWAKENKYSLSTETTLQQDLLVAETELERAQKKKEDVTAQLEKAGNLRFASL